MYDARFSASSSLSPFFLAVTHRFDRAIWKAFCPGKTIGTRKTRQDPREDLVERFWSHEFVIPKGAIVASKPMVNRVNPREEDKWRVRVARYFSTFKYPFLTLFLFFFLFFFFPSPLSTLEIRYRGWYQSTFAKFGLADCRSRSAGKKLLS